MALTNCPPGVWTTIPAVGADMHLWAPGRGFYVSTEAVPPTNPAEAFALEGGASMVITAGLPVAVQPAVATGAVSAISQPV